MQQSKISKVRENTKNYHSAKANATLYVHTVNFENDPVDYEHHSKSAIAKYKPGETMWYDLTTDNYGNKKIKPSAGPPPSAATAPPTGHQYVSGGPSIIPSLSPISYNEAWLRIFQGICALKTGQATLVDVIKHTDELAERFK